MKHLILAISIPFLANCHINYLVKSSYHQVRLLTQRVDFEEALKDPSLDEETKRKIRLVQEIKEFTENKLTLLPTKNYSSFVKLKGPYVIYAITASPKDKLEAYLWTFPIVGSVPYKGFFVEEDALVEKSEMESKGYDVAKRGVSAFSTLGWFSDPLLSSLTRQEDDDFVETIIHELTHATLYIKSNANFNEQFANFVGQKGMEEFYLSKDGPQSKSLSRARDKTYDGLIFSSFITETLAHLEEFYKNNGKSSNLMELREKEFSNLKKDFIEKCLPKMKTKTYSYFASETLNNASLMSYKTYYDDLSLFEKAFTKLGNWEAYIKFFKDLQNSDDPQSKLKAFVDQP